MDEVKVSQAARDSRVARYLSDQKAARENLATYPEKIRQRLEAWQTEQREWFSDTILEIVAEFITIDDAIRHQVERETLARMEWRDIESAPKDGTRFLAWCPYVGRVIMRIDGVHRETWAIDPSGRLGCDPTKWMPLPPAPEAGQ